VEIQDVTDYAEFTGATDACDYAEVLACSGHAQEYKFTPCSRVKKDISCLQSIQGIRGSTAGARVDETLAIAELARAKELYKKSADPESDTVKWQGKPGTAQVASKC
jgi:hypothetical protein